MRRYYDTCALLEKGEKLEDDFIISQITIKEIENIKTGNRDEELKAKARAVSRALRDKLGKYEVVVTTAAHEELIKIKGLPITNDNLIVVSAFDYKDVEFVTSDINCFLIAKNFYNLNVVMLHSENNESEVYKGYREVEGVKDIDTNPEENVYGLNINEFAVVKEDDKIVDIVTWTGAKTRRLKYKDIHSQEMGHVKPRNIEQKMLFDIMQNDDITVKVCSGEYGTGKDFCMLANAFDMIRKGKYDRLIWVRNNINVRGVSDIGFLPGTLEEKLEPYAMILADVLGGKEGFYRALENRVVELEHLGYIRGRTFTNSIVFMTEAENITSGHLKLLLSRIGENSILCLNGDTKQVDHNMFVRSNGLDTSIEKLKGQNRVGCIRLRNVERSETARLAEML